MKWWSWSTHIDNNKLFHLQRNIFSILQTMFHIHLSNKEWARRIKDIRICTSIGKQKGAHTVISLVLRLHGILYEHYSHSNNFLVLNVKKRSNKRLEAWEGKWCWKYKLYVSYSHSTQSDNDKEKGDKTKRGSWWTMFDLLLLNQINSQRLPLSRFHYFYCLYGSISVSLWFL